MTPHDNGAPIKIGVLFSSSGVTALVERTQINAVRLAVSEINDAGGILGRPIEAIEYDVESSAKIAAARAQDLLERDGVRLIFGCYMSSTRKAALPIIEKYRGLLFYPTLYEGFEFSSDCIYSGAAPNQNIVPLARYLMREYGERFYLVGSNYVYPYEANRVMRDFIVSFGGKVFEERYVPLDADVETIRSVVGDIAKHPDTVIISTIVGDGTASFYRECRRAGFDPSSMPIASMTTSEAEVAAMGAEAAEGNITSAPYFRTVQSLQNRRFCAAYEAKFGADAPISASTESAYVQVHLLANAAEQAGSLEPEAIKRALPACPFLAPQGMVRVDAENNHTYLWPRIGKANAKGEFDIVECSPSAVRPDPYLINPAEEDWSQRASNS